MTKGLSNFFDGTPCFSKHDSKAMLRTAHVSTGFDARQHAVLLNEPVCLKAVEVFPEVFTFSRKQKVASLEVENVALHDSGFTVEGSLALSPSAVRAERND